LAKKMIRCPVEIGEQSDAGVAEINKHSAQLAAEMADALDYQTEPSEAAQSSRLD
jgi:hypothetical protein